MAVWNIQVPTTEYYGPLPANPRGVVARDLGALIRELQDWRTTEIAIDTETTGLVVFREQVLYWSLAWGNRRCTLHASLLPYFFHIFEDPAKTWIFANAKFDLHMLANMGCRFAGKIWCVQVMHSLLFEEMSHRLKDMAKHLLGWRWSDFQDTFGKITVNNPPLALMQKAEYENFPLLCEYAANDAWGTIGVKRDLEPRLQQALTHSLFREIPPYIETLWDLFTKIEAPYTRVLWKNERNGILMNREYLESVGPQARREIEALEIQVCKQVGWRMNLGSNDDKKRYFFDQMRYHPFRMTKGGKSGIRSASTDADSVQHFADHYGDPVAKMMLEHSNLTKLEGTYINGISNWLDAHGRIHTRFNQDVTRTGRLSCLAEWTPIYTARGLVAIRDVQVGDHVWTHKGRWRPALKTIMKGQGHMFDLHLDNGDVLTCTPDHRLLSSDHQWIPAGDLIDEYLERMGVASRESDKGTETLSVARLINNGADCREVGDNLSQRVSCASLLHAGTGTQDISEVALLGVEDGEQEPHERKYGQRSPQLEGRVRRWVRLLDLSSQRQETIRPSNSNGPGIRLRRTSGRDDGSPHRRQSEEQCLGQSCSSYEGWSQHHSLFARRGLPGVEITQIHYRGRCEVYDLTIDEDASYLACGIYSHNSSDPNLQNIPTPEKDKWKLRSAFIAPKGKKLIVADYNQLEMRLLAAAAREQDMIDIFLRNWDIHMGNASMMMNIPYDEIKEAKKIDKEVKEGRLPDSALTSRVLTCLHARAAAKNIGFGLNYGMGPNKLANDLGIQLQEAIEKVALYKKTYPAVTKFYTEAVENCRLTGYSFTILGRRRNLPGIASSRNDERSRAERQAINVEIQGTAADVMKVAQIMLDKAELDRRFGCYSLLNIHDELIHECPDETVDEALAEIKEWMEHPLFIDLDVPLTVATGKGDNWHDAK